LREGQNRGEHGAGLLLLNTELLCGQFPSNKLAISWFVVGNPLEVEADLIDGYVATFGEAPPLNRQRRARDHQDS
jgi:hypothetical protein